MSATLPQEWLDVFNMKHADLIQQYNLMWEQAYAAGQAAGGGSTGYTQEELDAAVAAGVAAEQVRIKDALAAIDAVEDQAVDALFPAEEPSEPEPAA